MAGSVAGPSRVVPVDAGAASALRRRAQYYRSYAGWMIADLYRTLRRRVLQLVVLGILAVTTRALTFGILIAFLRALADGAGARIRGVPLPPVRTARDVLLWTAALVLAAALMAATQFLEARRRVRLGEDYARSLVRRVHGAIARRQADRDADELDLPTVRRLIGGSGLLVRAVQPALAPLVPVLTAMVALAVLLWLDAFLTVLLAVLGLAYVIPFYRLNRLVVQASRSRDRNLRAYRRETRRAARAALLPQFAPLADDPLPGAYLDSGAVRDRVVVFRSLLLNRGRVGALNNATFGAALVLVLVLGVARRASADDALAQLVTFAVCLRVAWGAVQQVTVAVAGFSRFLPQYAQYVDLLSGADDVAPTAAPGAQTTPELRIRTAPEAALGDVPVHVDLHDGVMLLLSRPVPQAVDARALWRRLTGAPLPRRAVVVEDPVVLPDLPLRQLLDPSGTGDDVEGAAALLGLDVAVRHLPDRDATRWDDAVERLPAGASTLVALAPALTLPADVAVVPLVGWDGLDEHVRARFRAAWHGALVLVAPRPPADVPDGTALAVLALGGQPIRYVDPRCYREAVPELQALLAADPPADGAASSSDDDFEDEDDNEDEDF